jgi:TonB family protein
MLRNERDFTKQRIVLLCGVVCALVFPLIEIPSGTVESVALTTIMLPGVVVGGNKGGSTDMIMTVYVMIMLVVALPILFHAIKVYRISKRANGRYKGDYYIVESNEDKPSWSFFRLIYIGRAAELNDEDKDLVLKHEMLHGRLLHSIDMLLTTLLCIVFWSNPVLWFYRQTMAKTHEFEVDSIIAKQDGVVGYSVLLAKTALSRNGFLLTHHFNQSFILKRINMINMIKSRISNWKLGALAAVIVLYFAAIACTEPLSENNTTTSEKKVDKTGEVYTIVDQSALPVDGITAFYEDLANKLEYPEQARKMGVEGKVFVEFIINKDGEISDIKVLKGIGAGCDDAAIRAMREMKPWNPGKHDGVAIRQRMVMPITFKLDD